MKLTRVLSVLALAASGYSGAAAAQLNTVPELPLELALKMAAACTTLAQQQGWKMHVSIHDAGDNPKVYVRMDGSLLGPGDISRRKASSAARFIWPTSQVAGMAFNQESGPTAMAFLPGTIPVAGGLPITTASGQLIGGIGVSGGMPNQDEECARAGLDAVKDDLR